MYREYFHVYSIQGIFISFGSGSHKEKYEEFFGSMGLPNPSSPVKNLVYLPSYMAYTHKHT